MPTVPWIRLYQNWPRHRKTKALRRAIGTAEPILCLWLWAAENAPDGVLDGLSPEDIEDAAEWQGKRGRALAAMVDAGFIDVMEDGGMRLHNWKARAGAGVANLEKRRERAREHMRSVRANKALTDCERERQQGANTMPANGAETLSLSPDLGTSGSSLPEADPDPERACSNGCAKPTGYDLLRWFGAARSEAFSSALSWVTPRNADGDAETFAAKLPPDSWTDVRPSMALFFRHVKAGDKGWDAPKNTTDPSFGFGSWKSGFTALREELHGVAPAPKAAPMARAANGPRPVVWRES